MRLLVRVLSVIGICAATAPLDAQELTIAAFFGCRLAIQTDAISTEAGSVRFVRNGRVVELLQGSKAFDHLSQKRLRHPQRFLHFAGALAAKGYRPTETIVVIRSIGPASLAEPHRERELIPLFVATVESNSEGEQIFWSWDDGNDATWEGSQYVERYSDGAWVSYDAQLDISNDEGNVIWSEQTGRGGRAVYDQTQVRQGQGHLSPLLRRVMLPVKDVLNESPIQEWAVCLAAGCGGCAGGCWFTGPKYPECFGSCCFGVSIACALEYYLGGGSSGGGGDGSGGGGGGGWITVGPDGSA